MLCAALETLHSLPLHEEDTLVFLGDYIDRGENSCAVIETLLELQEQHADIIFLRGNHEQFMINALDGPSPEASPAAGFVLHAEPTLIWLQNGGAETLLSYGVQDAMRWWESIPETHWEFIRATQMEYITEYYHFVHAGVVPPGEIWVEGAFGLDARLWIREPFLSSRADFDGRRVVFGHTPQVSGRPLVQRNKIGLDTAAVFGGPLTIAAFNPDKTGRKLLAPQFFQIPHLRADP
jgi:serine/threonine protein phosphatase 1